MQKTIELDLYVLDEIKLVPILKSIGMKKPPAILQYKVAQALGELANRGAGSDPFKDPNDPFGP